MLYYGCFMEYVYTHCESYNPVISVEQNNNSENKIVCDNVNRNSSNTD